MLLIWMQRQISKEIAIEMPTVSDESLKSYSKTVYVSTCQNAKTVIYLLETLVHLFDFMLYKSLVRFFS